MAGNGLMYLLVIRNMEEFLLIQNVVYNKKQFYFSCLLHEILVLESLVVAEPCFLR